MAEPVWATDVEQAEIAEMQTLLAVLVEMLISEEAEPVELPLVAALTSR
jgi:hypothetical protein